MRLRLIASGALFLVGLAALFGLYYYAPTWNTREVVQVVKPIARNQTISSDEVKMKRVASADVPKDVVTALDEAVGKVALISLPPGVTLTSEFFDPDDLTPKAGEEIFPVPREAIYSVNTSLRARDLVDISLFKDGSGDEQAESVTRWHDVKVVAARNDAGNMVQDTESGNTNDRLTATDRIGPVELLLKSEDADAIRQAVAEGFKLWISRVN